MKVFLNTELEFQLEAIENECSDDYITSCIRRFGNWEPNVTEKFLRILDKALQYNAEGAVLDVGACFGYYSLIAGKKGYRTFAFEPNPEVFSLLKKNIEQVPGGNILINDFALGNENDFISINIPDKNIGGAHLEKGNTEGNQVKVKRLDEFELPSRITIFKIDVEGFEIEVIKGALQTIKQNQIDFIFIEISPKFLPVSETVKWIFNSLWDAGYLSFDIGLQDSGEMEKAIRTFSPFSDEQVLINYLQNIGQTNFLFVKKEKTKSKFITGTFWKDELLQEWLYQGVLEFQEEIKSNKILFNEITHQVDELKRENRKLFDQLVKAGTFQEELLNVIKERDEELGRKAV